MFLDVSRRIVPFLVGLLLLATSACGGSAQQSAECERAHEIAMEALELGTDSLREIEDVDQEGHRLVAQGDEIQAKLERARSAGDFEEGFELLEELEGVADSLDQVQIDRDRLVQDADQHFSRSSIAVEQNPDCFTVDERVEAETMQRRVNEL